MGAPGLTQAEIANELGIDEKTLRKHFRVELSSGKFAGCGEANAACAILA
jgi:predicted transcriptional regulator